MAPWWKKKQLFLEKLVNLLERIEIMIGLSILNLETGVVEISKIDEAISLAMK